MLQREVSAELIYDTKLKHGGEVSLRFIFTNPPEKKTKKNMNGRTQRSRCRTRRTKGRSVVIIVAYPSVLTPAKHSSKSSRAASAPTVSGKMSRPRSSVASYPSARPSTVCCDGAPPGTGEEGHLAVHVVYRPRQSLLSPWTDPSCGLSYIALACHQEYFPSFANSTTACELVCS